MTGADDIEAFLLMFERTASQEEWTRDEWAGILAPFLTGEAQKAYHDLPLSDATDYDKAEILARARVTTAVQAQKYHAWTFNPSLAPCSQMFDLIHLAQRWLGPDVNNGYRVVKLIVMDCYMRAMPGPLRKWIGQNDPSNIDGFVSLVERQLAADDLARAPPSNPGHWRPKTSPELNKGPIPERGVEERA